MADAADVDTEKSFTTKANTRTRP